MKIIYKQSPSVLQEKSLQNLSPLAQLGIGNCHFKLVTPAKDHHSITLRAHHHTSCEMHIITAGCEYYTVGEDSYTIAPGQLLLIPPNMSHRHLRADPDTRKYSVTFTAFGIVPGAIAEHFYRKVFHTKLPEAALAALQSIDAEADRRREFTDAAMECHIFLFLLALARSTGFHEQTVTDAPEPDLRVRMAQQYVQDNIDRPITCQELAEYCHLSQKQLSRLFLQFTGKNPAAYIRTQKILRLEHLLAETDLSIKAISDRMHFSSECHFSSFFTKYAGLTPGAYRKMNS